MTNSILNTTGGYAVWNNINSGVEVFLTSEGKFAVFYEGKEYVIGESNALSTEDKIPLHEKDPFGYATPFQEGEYVTLQIDSRYVGVVKSCAYGNASIDWTAPISYPITYYSPNQELQRISIGVYQQNLIFHIRDEQSQANQERSMKEIEREQKMSLLFEEFQVKELRTLESEEKIQKLLEKLEKLEEDAHRKEEEKLNVDILKTQAEEKFLEIPKREKIKFFLKQVAKGVGKEIILRIAAKYGVNMEWLFPFL